MTLFLNNVESISDRLGEIALEALQVGGEPLLDSVEAALGVAKRHLERVRSGVLPLAQSVRDEIQRSFDDAEHLIRLHREGRH